MTDEEKENRYWESTGTGGLRNTKEMQIGMANQKANLLRDDETIIASQVGVPGSADQCDQSLPVRSVCVVGRLRDQAMGA